MVQFRWINPAEVLVLARLKKYILNIAKKHHVLLVALRKLRFIYYRVRCLFFYYTVSVNEKTVVFDAFMGRQFACSPKALYLEMLKDKRFDDFTFVWAFKNPGDFDFLLKNKNTVTVKYESSDYFKYCAKAKFWITNSRLNEALKKKSSQVYIQCWHGTPLKKLGYDIEVKGGNAMNSVADIRHKYKVDSKRYTYMISPSPFCTEKFASAFDLEHPEILKEVGYPRNDYLFNFTNEDVNRIKKSLNIPEGKKVVLYAPTWRDDCHESGKGYVYSSPVDFEKLREQLGGDCVILFRTHYFISNYIDLSLYEDFVINVSTYNDINELYVISDVLVTDYSSVFFDYANLKRPIIFYMYDYDSYKNTLRDFYIDTKELPGPIVKAQDELGECILNSQKIFDTYSDTYSRFISRFCCHEDGNAAKRVVEECIINNMSY